MVKGCVSRGFNHAIFDHVNGSLEVIAPFPPNAELAVAGVTPADPAVAVGEGVHAAVAATAAAVGRLIASE